MFAPVSASNFDRDTYERAYDAIHAMGCTIHAVEVDDAPFELETGDMLIAAPDETTYRIAARELHLFAIAADIKQWQVEGQGQ